MFLIMIYSLLYSIECSCTSYLSFVYVTRDILITFFSTKIDPVELESPLMKQALHFMQDQSQAPAWMHETKKKIDEAHG